MNTKGKVFKYLTILEKLVRNSYGHQLADYDDDNNNDDDDDDDDNDDDDNDNDDDDDHNDDDDDDELDLEFI